MDSHCLDELQKLKDKVVKGQNVLSFCQNTILKKNFRKWKRKTITLEASASIRNKFIKFSKRRSFETVNFHGTTWNYDQSSFENISVKFLLLVALMWVTWKERVIWGADDSHKNNCFYVLLNLHQDFKTYRLIRWLWVLTKMCPSNHWTDI